jgi:hypothetical protein
MNLTNVELNKLSVNDLEDLNKRLINVLRKKIAIESMKATDTFSIGQTVKYSGNGKLHNLLFEVIKINKVNIVCKDKITKQLWNIKASTLTVVK